MPLVLHNSLQIGPRGGASAPATLQAYLTSIGKDSWYAIFNAGQGMAANSDGSGSVADGGQVGCWAAQYASGWTAKFIQATSAARMLYSTSASGLGATIGGNASSYWMYLDSTTALDKDFTILGTVDCPNDQGYTFYKGTGDAISYYRSASAVPNIYWAFSAESGDALDRAVSQSTVSSWRRIRRFAISSGAGTNHYGNALRLNSNGSAYFTGDKWKTLALTPKLTRAECQAALAYL